MKPVWEWDIENAIATAFHALAAEIRQAATEGQPSVLDQYTAVSDEGVRLKEQLKETLTAQKALIEALSHGIVPSVEYVRQMNRMKAEESR